MFGNTTKQRGNEKIYIIKLKKMAQKKSVSQSPKEKCNVFEYAVTGTFHGAIVYAATEGDARRAFHKKYNGESITHVNRIF